MSSSKFDQRSLDPLIQSGTSLTTENPSRLFSNIQPLSPAKRAREASDRESDCDDTVADMDRMDFQRTEHLTATQAIGNDDENTEYITPQLPLPLSAEHAALRSDFEIIAASAMERLYRRIAKDMEKSVSDTRRAFETTTDQLQNQISSLGIRVSQLQQQILTYQQPIQPSKTTPAAVSTKKVLRLSLSKKSAGDFTAQTAPASTESTPMMVSTTSQKLPTNNRGWETVQSGSKKMKAATTPKLIPTKFPQIEREVTCHFHQDDTNDTTTQLEKPYTERQALADIALRRINSAFVDNKDVLVPPFIRARVTTRGSIVFTTGNHNRNVVYEDYITIIKDALAYYGKCETVEIGKRFSQFLLHGVPTHLSIHEISDSIKTNYPQLIQGQTPRWLTPADRREHKANSTIVLTLTGNVKKTDIGRQNLIVGNRQCQLDDYISFGRSTQCRKCQAYGHPAALCQNDPRCAVCAESHETREHPCTLPTCRKGPTCTHPPIRCANCGTPHKASDPNCPERIKLRTINKATPVVNQGDAPMAGAAN
jgi:hypothetical protein